MNPVYDADGHVIMGMTLRDRFASQAMVGTLASVEALGPFEGAADIAQQAYRMADKMLEAREAYTVNPLQAELDQARAQIDSLESLRPHWAQGYSSDSVAAQSATSALSSIWRLLGVPHQTAAMERIRNLLALEASA